MDPSGDRSFIRRHPVGLAVGGVVAAGLLAWLAFGFFGVQTLWVDDEVDEAGPVFDSGATVEEEPATAPDGTQPAAPSIEVLAEGSFVARDHPAEGTATVLGDGTGQRFLRFTDFATDNGPDLNVYLSTAAPDADGAAFDDEFVDLGDLRGNVGDQNYEVPADVDLSAYRSVVVWCVRFGVPFGAAPLTPTA